MSGARSNRDIEGAIQIYLSTSAAYIRASTAYIGASAACIRASTAYIGASAAYLSKSENKAELSLAELDNSGHSFCLQCPRATQHKIWLKHSIHDSTRSG